MRSKKARDTAPFLVPLVLILAGTIIIVSSIYKKMNKAPEKTVHLETSEPALDSKAPSVLQAEPAPPQPVPIENPNLKPTPLPAQPDPQQVKSDSNLTKFWNLAQINFPVPKELDYSIQDSEDANNVVVLFGTSKENGTTLVLIGRGALTHPSEIIPFLKTARLAETPEKPALLPDKLPAPTAIVPLSMETGLRDVQVWGLGGRNQDRIIALANRIDKKGSYAIIYTVPKGDLKKTEEFVIAIFKQAKIPSN